MLCRECGTEMKEGKAMIPVYGKGLPDFIGDPETKVLPGDTISPISSAYGTVHKCPKCGHSFGPGLLVSEGKISER